MSAAPHAAGPWLLSRRADLALFGGPALASIALLVWGKRAGLLDGDLPPALFLLTVVCVDVAHVWATGWRVYADPVELRSRPALYTAIPAGAYVAGVALASISSLLFWRVLAYAAVFHFVRQQYGWVALYRRKSGEAEEGAWARRLDTATIYACTVAPLVFWHARLPRRFHWFLAGDFVQGLMPAWAGPASMAILGVLLASYALKEIARARLGRTVSWGKSLVVATTAATWTLGIVVFDSDYAFTVTNVLVHGVPYFGIVLATSRSRAAAREAVAGAAAPRSLADRAARSLPLFLAPLLLLAFAEEWGWDRLVWHDHPMLFPGPAVSPSALALTLLVPLLALPQATHYLLDGFLWRVKRENADAARAVGLEREAVAR